MGYPVSSDETPTSVARDRLRRYRLRMVALRECEWENVATGNLREATRAGVEMGRCREAIEATEAVLRRRGVAA